MKLYSKKLLWIWLLYLSAGYLNALTLTLFSETVVGQTGRLTNMIYYFFQEKWTVALSLLLFSAAFLMGSVIGGLIFPKNTFNPRSKRFGWALIVMGIGLIIMDSLPGFPLIIMYYVCTMLGIQNSLFLSYRGIPVFSVVVTSVFSSLGSAVGNRLRGEKQATNRIIYFSSALLAYVIGAGLCFLVYFKIPYQLLEVVVALYLVSGFYFLKYRNEFFVKKTF